MWLIVRFPWTNKPTTQRTVSFLPESRSVFSDSDNFVFGRENKFSNIDLSDFIGYFVSQTIPIFNHGRETGVPSCCLAPIRFKFASHSRT